MTLGVLTLSGCPKSQRLPESIYSNVSFEEVFPQVSNDLGPFALRGTYRLKIRGTGQVVPSLSGAILMVPFTKFRTEVRGPVGGPMITGVSDGEAMGLYLASENLWVSSEDLSGDIDSLTSGIVAFEDLLSMSLGRLVTTGMTPSATGSTAEGPWGRFDGADGSAATMYLDPARGVVSSLHLADEHGDVRLVMTHTSHMMVDDIWFPEQTLYQLVGTELEVEFNYSAWDRLGSIPSAFGVSAPAGAEVITIRELAARINSLDEVGNIDEQSVQPSITNDELGAPATTPGVDLE